MKDILEKHPDLKDILNKGTLNTYRVLSECGTLLEQWERNKNGHWVDVTEREKLKEKIAAEQEELERLNAR
jgi:hypothetical protein